MRIALTILAALSIVSALPIPERKVDVDDDSDLNWRFEDEDVEMFSVEYLQSFNQPYLKKQASDSLPKVQDYKYNWKYDEDDDEYSNDNDKEEYVKIASEIIDEDDQSYWSPESDTSLMNDDELDFANDADVIALLLSSADPDYNLIEAAIIMRKEVNRAHKNRPWPQNQKLVGDYNYEDIHSDT
ncbi:hypothetical protein BGW37DRAFT_507207 [Umbelopsis sp. PMI_123]|nr:hypothetical protein BGW37DRAFT_507207 [Umbelopsis sp. PMI_123]